MRRKDDAARDHNDDEAELFVSILRTTSFVLLTPRWQLQTFNEINTPSDGPRSNRQQGRDLYTALQRSRLIGWIRRAVGREAAEGEAHDDEHGAGVDGVVDVGVEALGDEDVDGVDSEVEGKELSSTTPRMQLRAGQRSNMLNAPVFPTIPKTRAQTRSRRVVEQLHLQKPARLQAGLKAVLVDLLLQALMLHMGSKLLVRMQDGRPGRKGAFSRVSRRVLGGAVVLLVWVQGLEIEG
ncbi:hypothetical protein FPV67DRAFT_1448832 [Lyophyllum atratum]|nr:hypothetical protein FPV67DRAFT_1448832 [Lyophyllum atratum]